MCLELDRSSKTQTSKLLHSVPHMVAETILPFTVWVYSQHPSQHWTVSTDYLAISDLDHWTTSWQSHGYRSDFAFCCFLALLSSKVLIINTNYNFKTRALSKHHWFLSRDSDFGLYPIHLRLLIPQICLGCNIETIMRNINSFRPMRVVHLRNT